LPPDDDLAIGDALGNLPTSLGFHRGDVTMSTKPTCFALLLCVLGCAEAQQTDQTAGQQKPRGGSGEVAASPDPNSGRGAKRNREEDDHKLVHNPQFAVYEVESAEEFYSLLMEIRSGYEGYDQNWVYLSTTIPPTGLGPPCERMYKIAKHKISIQRFRKVHAEAFAKKKKAYEEETLRPQAPLFREYYDWLEKTKPIVELPE
jgi:hypothetical protein